MSGFPRKPFVCLSGFPRKLRARSVNGDETLWEEDNAVYPTTHTIDSRLTSIVANTVETTVITDIVYTFNVMD